MIMCYMKGINGLGYDNGHNYRRWTLVSSPTVFHDDDPRWVYIAIPKSDAVDVRAQLVFPSEELDIYGCNAQGQQIGPTDYYYIFTQGIISASRVGGVTQDRTWTQTIDCGKLASDEAIAAGGEGSWWEYNATNDMVKFLKTIIEAIFEKLTASWANITQLVLHGHIINGVAGENTLESSNDTLVTPKYADDHWLSSTHDDVAHGDITFNNSIHVKGETILKRTVTIGDYEKDIQVGIGSREGVRILPDGTIIARSLELSQELSVPTLKYNSIEVLAGTRWDSAGKGRVKEVIENDETNHTCQFVLDLNDGEPGEFIVNDILRGFWHNMDGTKNAVANSDDRRGNINRAGFQSIYARAIAVANVIERVVDDVTYYIAQDSEYVPQQGDRILENGLVTVQMRQFNTSPATYSPAPEKWSVLSVSGYFGTDHPERGWGDLTGFTMLEDHDGQITRKEFTGEGFVTKDAHIYGVVDMFTRFSDRIDIQLSRPDGTIADGEQQRADFILRDVEGSIISGNYTLQITRQSGNAAADTAWNAAIAQRYPSGIPSALYFQFSDVPEKGAVFVVAASRQVTTDTTTDTFTTSASFVLSRAYAEELFLGPWDAATEYTKTPRQYPTVTHGGCKWYLKVASSLGEEPHPLSTSERTAHHIGCAISWQRQPLPRSASAVWQLRYY